MLLYIITAYPAYGADITEASIPSYRIINSSQIIDKINNDNNINYNNIVIIGDLNPSKKNIQSAIRISNSVFIGDVNFDGAIFHKPVEFEDTVFKKIASFDNAQFEGPLIFLHSRFNGSSGFKETRFKDDVSFSYTIFNDYLNFQGSQFCSGAAFDSTIFNKFARYDYIKFQGYTDFKNSEFIKGAQFSYTAFEGKVEFDKSIFKQRSFFNSAKFLGDATFDGANFENNVHFDRTEFVRDLILSNTTIHSIWINNAKFSKGSHITLNDSDFTRINTDWHSIRDHLYYNSFVYQAIVKNFHELLQFEDEDDCYYRYRNFERDHALDYILWITCGYGVKPCRAILISVLAILFFAVISYCFDIIRNGELSLDHDRGNHIDPLNAIYFSLTTFIAAPTNFRPFGEYKNLLKYLIPAERIAGWFMLAIFIIILNKIGMR
jgi:hypothetical protein